MLLCIETKLKGQLISLSPVGVTTQKASNAKCSLNPEIRGGGRGQCRGVVRM